MDKRIYIDIEGIRKIRKKLIKLLKKKQKIGDKTKIKFKNVPTELLEKIIFKEDERGYLVVALPFELIKELDLTGVSFDNVKVESLDFTGTYGVTLNPQTVAKKSFWKTNLDGVVLTGPLDDCDVRCASFEGTLMKNGEKVELNPKKVAWQSLWETNLAGVVLTGSLDGVNIEGTIFERCPINKNESLDSYNSMYEEFEKLISKIK